MGKEKTKGLADSDTIIPLLQAFPLPLWGRWCFSYFNSLLSRVQSRGGFLEYVGTLEIPQYIQTMKGQDQKAPHQS